MCSFLKRNPYHLVVCSKSHGRSDDFKNFKVCWDWNDCNDSHCYCWMVSSIWYSNEHLILFTTYQGFRELENIIEGKVPSVYSVLFASATSSFLISALVEELFKLILALCISVNDQKDTPYSGTRFKSYLKLWPFFLQLLFTVWLVLLDWQH